MTRAYEVETMLSSLRACAMDAPKVFVHYDDALQPVFRIEHDDGIERGLGYKEARGWIAGYVAGRTAQ